MASCTPALRGTAAAPARNETQPARPHRRRALVAAHASSAADKSVWLLDYGAGNVRSVRNAIKACGYDLKEVRSAADLARAERLIFPGVGAYEQAMGALKAAGLDGALADYVRAGRPFLGICLGLQLLFDGSEENGGVPGLGLIPGSVRRFTCDRDAVAPLPVPHIGWNDLTLPAAAGEPAPFLGRVGGRRVYFVHSFRAEPSPSNADWVAATSDYGGPFVAAVRKGDVCATQFHPEKSGKAGLDVLRGFLEGGSGGGAGAPSPSGRAASTPAAARGGLARRVIACLDVRANDAGDLVVTKGDQYDVREDAPGDGAGEAGGGDGARDARDVRNLGKPVDLARRYYEEGADEVTFLNITGFRETPLGDLPMLEVLRRASEGVFVPLTVGGGIRASVDPDGTRHSALAVAAEYFRSGADKVSIGSDAVEAALEYYARGGKADGSSAIEQISWNYGAQAVVVSIDPRRVYVSDPADTPRPTVKTATPGPNGEQWVWWQCTVKGGREGRDLDAVELARAVEALGAGEILLNCIDRDGQGTGFDLELVSAVAGAVGIPVIASSGAGAPEHFTEVFRSTPASAALAAGIFHRREVPIEAVKAHMEASGLPTRVN